MKIDMTLCGGDFINSPLEADEEIDVTIHYSYIAGRPAYTSGPIECCYPEEYPEVEIDEIYNGKDLVTYIPKEETYNRIIQEIVDSLPNGGYAFR